ncbi:MAG TPA: hypothetical protein VK284_09750 [Streptosporangiaceae bacterium]|nr:hypothetical protein [Streptosporangiaceae bacterium]
MTGVRGGPGTRGAVPGVLDSPAGALDSPGPGRDTGDGGTGGSGRAAPSAGAVLWAGVLGLAPSGAAAPARSAA